MALNIGEITASLSLEIDKFTSAANKVLAQTKSLGSQMSSAFGPSALNNMNNMNNATNKMANNLKDVDRIVSGILISQVFYNAANAIEAGVSALVRFSNNMQTAQVSMEYFLGSAERAEGFIKVMQDFAATTPFSTEQSLDLSRKLMAMGFQAENIRSIMQILVDSAAASGGTADELNRIVIALGQINTQGFLAGQELRQLANANIPIYKILQEELGLTADQMKEIGKLKIPADIGVAAILKGLRNRYAGASDELNERTVSGMWSNIKDDILIVGEQIIKGPYEALNAFVKNLYNTMETARDIVVKSGLGGLFEHFVPKELHETIRIIVGSLKSLADSFGILAKAMKPVISMVASTFAKALGAALPVIASIVRVVANMASAFLQASPFVRIFAASILSLLIANTVAKSLMFLWQVTRLGVICAAVAQAVQVLAKAIKALYLIMTRNPIAGVIMVIAGALLSLALSSKTVTAWLDQLMAKLGQLSGFETDDILQPGDTDGIDKWIDEFNKDLEHMNDDLKGVGKELDGAGDSADKAGKKVKDKFVAAFDELYQVPDKLDELGTGIDGIGDLDLKLPDLPNLSLPNIGGLPDIKEDLKELEDIKPIFGVDFWGTIPPLNLAPVTQAIATINALIADLKLKLVNAWDSLKGWVADMLGQFGALATGALQALGSLPARLGAIITEWMPGALSALNGFATEGFNILNQFALNGLGVITQWVMDTATILGDWVLDTASKFTQWQLETVGDFATWVKESSVVFAQWAMSTAADFAKWVLDTSKTLAGWTLGTAADFAKWTINTAADLAKWSTETLGQFATWVAGATEKLNGWATDGLKTVTQWISTTTADFAKWSTNVLANFGTWVGTTSTKFAEWSKTNIATLWEWCKTTSTNFGKWATNVVQNFGSWATTTGKNFGNWATSTATTIGNWIKGTAANFGNWITTTSKNFGSWASAAASNIGQFAKASWSTFNEWLSGTAANVRSWASNTLTNIVSWAKSAWQTISELASAAGQSISSGWSSFKTSVGEAWAPIGKWAGEHKTEIAITAAVAGIALTAIALAPATGGWSLAGLAALESGGIVDQDGIYRMGEKNKREVVIPLENSTYMRPFSAAVANDLARMIGPMQGGQSRGDDRPVVYVHTLIADDRGLKELERKLEVIRVNESTRKGE